MGADLLNIGTSSTYLRARKTGMKCFDVTCETARDREQLLYEGDELNGTSFVNVEILTERVRKVSDRLLCRGSFSLLMEFQGNQGRRESSEAMMAVSDSGSQASGTLSLCQKLSRILHTTLRFCLLLRRFRLGHCMSLEILGICRDEILGAKVHQGSGSTFRSPALPEVERDFRGNSKLPWKLEAYRGENSTICATSLKWIPEMKC